VELKIGDLVRHKVHGFYGIVMTNVGNWGATKACRVDWCESGRNHIIDIYFLDKISKS